MRHDENSISFYWRKKSVDKMKKKLTEENLACF